MRVMKPESKGRKNMPSVVVAPVGNGKYKVLINYVQHGIDYSSEALAQNEANKIRKKLEVVYNK